MYGVVERVSTIPIVITALQRGIVRRGLECHVNCPCAQLAKFHKENWCNCRYALEENNDHYAEKHCEDANLECTLILGNLIIKVVCDDRHGIATVFGAFFLFNLINCVLLKPLPLSILIGRFAF